MATFVGTDFVISSPDATPGTVISTTTGILAKPGRLFAAFSKWEGAAGAVDTVLDSVGNSYVRASPFQRNTTNNDLEGGWVAAISRNGHAKNLFTQSLSASRPFRRLLVVALDPRPGYRFILRPNLIVTRSASAQNAGSAAPASGSFTAIGPGVALAGVGEYDVVTYTPGSGWTEGLDQASYAEYRLLVSGALINGDAVSTLSMAWVAAAFSIVEVPLRATSTPFIFPTPLAAAVFRVGGTQSFSYTAAGGLTLAGAAAVLRARVAAAAGGLVLAGAAAFAKGKVVAAAGGVQLGGSAVQIRVRVPAPSGGLQLGGAAGYATSGAQSFSYAAQGGLSLGGSAAQLRVAARTALGGLQLGGAAAAASHEQQRVVTPSGGLSIGGAASVSTFDSGAKFGDTPLNRRRRR